MLSHSEIWGAIDRLALKLSISPSRLARDAGLDATSFNKSKRITAAGKPRWPSTESIAKVLRTVNMDFEDFACMAKNKGASGPAIPVIGLAQAGVLRAGDKVLVAPNATVRRGDRVVVKTIEGEVMAKELRKLTETRVELASLNPDYEDRDLARQDIQWIGRIIWVSQ